MVAGFTVDVAWKRWGWGSSSKFLNAVEGQEPPRARRSRRTRTPICAANRRETLAPRKRRVPQLLQRGDAVAGGARAQLGNERRDVPGDGPGGSSPAWGRASAGPRAKRRFSESCRTPRGGSPFRALRQKPLDVVQGAARGRVDLHAGLLRSPHHRVVARLRVRLGVRLEAQARAPPPLERGGITFFGSPRTTTSLEPFDCRVSSRSRETREGTARGSRRRAPGT